MQITDLVVENVRRFAAPHGLRGLGPGLNVLAAPNESGKSTLLASLQAVLFQKYDSRSEALRALIPAGSETAPRISLGFSIGAHSYRLEKRFLSRPLAVLVASDGARFEADEAETRLRGLLGVARSGKTTQIGTWNALWVAQGHAFAQAELGDELTRTTLTACLEQELGHVAGYGDADRRLREAEQLLSALRDKRGARRGRGASLAQDLRLAEQEIELLTARGARLAEDIDALIALRARAARLGAETLVLENAQALVAGRAALEAAVRREAEQERRAAARDMAIRVRQGAEARIAARAASRRAAAEAEEAARRASAQSEAAVRIAADAETALVAAARTLHEAERALDASASRVAACLRATAAGEARARHDARRDILRRARRIEAEIAALAGRLDTDKVDDARLGALRKALAEADALRARLAAQATSVSFALDPGAPPIRVTHGHAAPHPPGNLPIDITEHLIIEIEGVGVIEIRPATIGRGAAVAARARAEDVLASMLAECGVANLAEAEAQHAARVARDAALRAARAELARLVPGDAATGLAPGIEALAASIASDAERLAREDASPRAPEELAAALHAAREEEALLRTASATARARHEAALTADAASRATAQASVATAEAALRAASERAALLAAELGAEPDALLESLLAEARRDEARAIAEAAQSADGLDSETLRHRVARLEEAEANRAAERRALGERIAAAQARIEEAGGAGIEEALADQERKRDAASRELRALDRDAEALALLCATLRETIDRARATTLAPLTRRIAPLVSALLPGAEVFCDETFQVGAVARGTVRERFELLSDGTREQIAVLARIALADLLMASGRPASIVLDDALAFSDPERIERMFDILHRAAARMQIIVLTCRDDLFGRLGGRRLELVKLDDFASSPDRSPIR